MNRCNTYGQPAPDIVKANKVDDHRCTYSDHSLPDRYRTPCPRTSVPLVCGSYMQYRYQVPDWGFEIPDG